MTDPIPTSERLPGLNDMPDGFCWWFFPETEDTLAVWVAEDEAMDREPPRTHWLPSHAITVLP